MTNLKRHVREQKTTYITLGIFFAILIVWPVVYTAVSKINGVGTIQIANIRGGVFIYVDGVQKEQTQNGTNDIFIDTTPDEHEVVIIGQNTFPWKKTITIQDGQTYTIYPFLLEKTVSLNRQDNTTKIQELFANNPNPNETTKGTVHIEFSGTSLIAYYEGDATPPYFFCHKTCKDEQLITELQTPPTRIAIHPKRNDLVLLAKDNQIGLIEIDTAGGQNYQPLYMGTHPDFRLDNNTLYIHDDDTYYSYIF